MKSWFQSFSIKNFLISLTWLRSINFILNQFFNNLVIQTFKDILRVRWKKNSWDIIICFRSYLLVFYNCIVPNKLNNSFLWSYEVVCNGFKFVRYVILLCEKHIIEDNLTLFIFLISVCTQNEFREVILKRNLEKLEKLRQFSERLLNVALWKLRCIQNFTKFCINILPENVILGKEVRKNFHKKLISGNDLSNWELYLLVKSAYISFNYQVTILRCKAVFEIYIRNNHFVCNSSLYMCT